MTCFKRSVVVMRSTRKVRKPLHDNNNRRNNILNCTVQIENLSCDVTRKLPSFNSSVALKRLSTSDLITHLKKCSVRLPNTSDEYKKRIMSKHVGLKNSSQKSSEKENQNTTNNSIDEVLNQSKPKQLSLRKRKYKIDYARFNRGSSLSKTPIVDHVPIYKEPIKEKESAPIDVYEFDSDSEQKKRKRRKDTLDASVPFEKGMKEELRKIEQGNKRRIKRKQRIAAATKEKRTEYINRLRYDKVLDTNHRKLIDVTEAIKLPVKRTENINRLRYAKDHNTNDRKVIDVTEAIKLPQQEAPIVTSSAIHGTGNGASDLSSDEEDMACGEVEICTNDTDLNIVNKNQVPEKKINILQDVSLTTSIDNDLNKKDGEMDSSNGLLGAVNTTEIEEMFDFDTLKSPVSKSTPWRPDLQVKRNPFFLQYNETLLPSYNQEMVIDSTAVEKVSSGSKTPKKYPDTTPKTKQTSILSYINGNSVCDSPDVIDRSLYDMHELSPIKLTTKIIRNSLHSSSDKENRLPSKSPVKHNKIGNTRRQILTDKVDNQLNTLNSLSKVNNEQNSLNSENNQSYFGFISDGSIDEIKPEKRRDKRDMWLFGKPIRIENYIKINRTRKGNGAIDNYEQQEETPEKSNEVINVEEVQDRSDAPTSDMPQSIGLFEDLEPIDKNKTSKKYDSKHRRRPRRISTNDLGEESEEDEHPHPRRRGKGQKTKQEEAEADKWAMEFNKMCQEVDSFPLEIE